MTPSDCLAPHILASIKPGANSIYVLEGKKDGWHDFKTKKSTIKYITRLAITGIDFVVNPKW
jgi:hypothetical protein